MTDYLQLQVLTQPLECVVSLLLNISEYSRMYKQASSSPLIHTGRSLVSVQLLHTLQFILAAV